MGDKGARGVLRSHDAAGLYVLGSHAPGDVHCQDDGSALGRKGDSRCRARNGHDHRGYRQEQQQRRHMASESGPLSQRLLDDTW